MMQNDQLLLLQIQVHLTRLREALRELLLEAVIVKKVLRRCAHRLPELLRHKVRHKVRPTAALVRCLLKRCKVPNDIIIAHRVCQVFEEKGTKICYTKFWGNRLLHPLEVRERIVQWMNVVVDTRICFKWGK